MYVAVNPRSFEITCPSDVAEGSLQKQTYMKIIPEYDKEPKGRWKMFRKHILPAIIGIALAAVAVLIVTHI